MGRDAGKALPLALALLLWAAMLILAACAVKPALARPSGPAATYPLVPLQTITGGWLVARVDPNGVPLPDSLKKFRALVYPTAVAARANDLYIADAGTRRIYRFDFDLQGLIELPRVGADTATRIQVAPDFSLYVLDTARSELVRFMRGGRELQKITSPLSTARLTDFAVDESMGRIYATDQLNQQLLLLHPIGHTGIPLSASSTGEVRVLGAVAVTRDVLYVVDSGAAAVVAFTREGRLLGRLGEGDLIQPRAVAVDRYERIFVIDGFDHALKVFRDGRLVHRIEAGKLGLNDITALTLDRDRLYLADGPGAKVAVFRIDPAEQEGRP